MPRKTMNTIIPRSLTIAVALMAMTGCGTQQTSLPASSSLSRGGDPSGAGREVTPSGIGPGFRQGRFGWAVRSRATRCAARPCPTRRTCGWTTSPTPSRPTPCHWTASGWDATDVTNAQFARFVHATGYVTVAERPPDPKAVPRHAAGQTGPRCGRVLSAKTSGPASPTFSQWWRYVPGADWKHPQGPKSTLAGMADHPVVEVWLGRRRRLCPLGRQTPADRGRMGIRRPWRPEPSSPTFGAAPSSRTDA